MKFKLYDITGKTDAKIYLNKLIEAKKTVEIKALSNSRTSKQNRAMHKFFVIVSNELNNLGIDFKYNGLKGMELSVMHTPEIVKQFIWKPIQLALFNIESTTKLDTEKINKIADVIIRYFGNMGVVLEFPRKDINEI